MLKKLFSNELVKGSFSLFIMFNIFNALNFVFQFSMARLLGPAEYGVFAVLISLVYFIAIPSDTVQTFVSKYTARFQGKNEIGKIKSMAVKIFFRGLKYSLIAFIMALPFIYLLSYFLNISFFLVFLTSTLIFSIFLLPTTRGVMQGMKKFNSLGINMIVEGTLKVILAVLFVLAGTRVYGAVIGLLLGVVFAFVVSLLPLQKVFTSEKKEISIPNIYKNNSGILLILIAIMSVQSIDLIIAKRFFSDVVAGQYAVLNLMGKIIFFATIAVSKAMFPISSEDFSKGKKTNNIFKKSMWIVVILSIIGLAFYWTFPELIVGILFGAEYLAISSVVFNIGVAFVFISLANLVLLYGISIDSKIKLWHLVIFLVVQLALLLSLNNNLQEYSIAMILSGLVMFLGSLYIVKRKR